MPAIFISNQQIEEENKKQQELLNPPESKQPLIGLSGFIRTKWDLAKKAKLIKEQQLLKWKRQREMQYDANALAIMRVTFGVDYNPVYMGITETKCRAAEAWINDILSESDIELKPTPIPELPKPIEDYVNQTIFQTMFASVLDTSMTEKQPIDFSNLNNTIQQIMPIIRKKIDEAIKRKAKEAADRMKEKIKDQFVEGGWEKAKKDCIYDIVTYGDCFLKGPIQSKDKVRIRKLNEYTGQWINEIEDRIMSKYFRRSPFDIYPSADSTGIDDGYLFDKMPMTRTDLSNLIGVPKYDEQTIREILREHEQGKLKEWTAIDSERAALENKDSSVVYDSEKIDCLHYMGSCPGKYLVEWGLDELEIPDVDLEYEIDAYMIGNKIIKAMLNPDPLGKKQISKAGFSEDPDSFWSKGVSELIEPIQRLGNVSARAIYNHTSIASGPQVEVDVQRLAPGEKAQIWPWKIWKTTNEQMKTGDAVRFYMPTYIADRLMALYEFCLKLADEDSGVPRYAHGETTVSGAGDTSSGLAMLIKNASRGIGNVVANFVKGIIIPTVEKQFYFNLDYEKDINLIGDCKVVSDIVSIASKEHMALRRTDFMDRTVNPVDMQILGLNGRKLLLEETAKTLDIDVEKLFEEYDVENKVNPIQPGMPTPNMGDTARIEEGVNTGSMKPAGQDYTLFQHRKQK